MSGGPPGSSSSFMTRASDCCGCCSCCCCSCEGCGCGSSSLIQLCWGSSAERSPTVSTSCGSSSLPLPRPNAISASDRCARVGAPEQLGPQHPQQVDQHDVQHHRLRRRGAHADGA